MFDLSYQKCKQIVDKMDNELSLKKFINTDFNSAFTVVKSLSLC